MKNSEVLVLGISCFYHDSAACLVRNGEIVAAAQEERFTRRKFDNNFPDRATEYCLQEGGVSPKDLAAVAFYEDPLVKLERVIEIRVRYAPLELLENVRQIRRSISDRLGIEHLIYARLYGFDGPVYFSHHHASHAASAFYPSPFERASIVVADGVGEWACTSIGKADESGVTILEENRFPHSIGMLYSAITQFLGFKVNSGEYKVMGLAPYGEPIFVNNIKDRLVQIHDDGSIELSLEHFDFMVGSKVIKPSFASVFGVPARQPEAALEQCHTDVARSIQVVLEEILVKIVTRAVQTSGYRDLCMAGGVALNCVANGVVLRSGLVDRMWIQPAAGDAGGALGAALLASHEILKIPRVPDVRDKQKASLLGPAFASSDIRVVLDSYGFAYERVNNRDELYRRIADLLLTENVVGLFQGRMEYGPRALGCRSILADARPARMQAFLNQKIKAREEFRPFAPIVLAEDASEWFDMNGWDSPYMLFTFDLASSKRLAVTSPEINRKGIDRLHEMRSRIQAVTHVDYSARVQTVDRNQHPCLHNILQRFKEKTGCPVLINTSFNVRGEPIVCSPLDALRCFMNTDMDWLVLEDFLIEKKRQGNALRVEQYASYFEPD